MNRSKFQTLNRNPLFHPAMESNDERRHLAHSNTNPCMSE
jgi:hypothetical protein